MRCAKKERKEERCENLKKKGNLRLVVSSRSSKKKRKNRNAGIKPAFRTRLVLLPAKCGGTYLFSCLSSIKLTLLTALQMGKLSLYSSFLPSCLDGSTSMI